MILTQELLAKALPTAPASAIALHAPKMHEAMAGGIITTDERIAMFVAHTAVETKNLTAFEENLNYSAAGLIQFFDTRYTAQLAAQHARHPQVIANHVYANRFGNGDEASGDGWKYRGRGGIHITFRDNYLGVSTALGIDFVANPDLLMRPEYAWLGAVWFWTQKHLNVFADKRDVKGATKVINGGYNGLADRQTIFDRTLHLLTVAA